MATSIYKHASAPPYLRSALFPLPGLNMQDAPDRISSQLPDSASRESIATAAFRINLVLPESFV